MLGNLHLFMSTFLIQSFVKSSPFSSPFCPFCLQFGISQGLCTEQVVFMLTHLSERERAAVLLASFLLPLSVFLAVFLVWELCYVTAGTGIPDLFPYYCSRVWVCSEVSGTCSAPVLSTKKVAYSRKLHTFKVHFFLFDLSEEAQFTCFIN